MKKIKASKKRIPKKNIPKGASPIGNAKQESGGMRKSTALKTKSGHKLTPQQARFCELYASDREFFGNGVQSYIEAYDVDTSKPGWYNVAKSGASENLTKPYILERIEEIFEAHGLNDIFVDKQLEKLILQDADFKSKLGAIQEYNKLKGRIINKQEFSAPIEIKGFLPKPAKGK